MTKKRPPEHLPSVISTYEQYLQHINKVPLLTPEEEYDLALKAWEDRGREAAHKLVLANLRFVVKIANEYRNYGLRVMDLIQEGNVGLMRAVRTFNPYKNVRLITYAVWWIRSYIHDFIQHNWSMVKMGTTTAQRQLFYKLRKEEEALEKAGFSPTTKLLSERLGVKEEEVEFMKERLSRRDLHLDAPISNDGNEATHLERLRETAPPPDTIISDEEQKNIFSKAIKEFKDSLKEKDLYILEHRLLSESPMTLEEIGNHFGITKERVRQIEEKVKKNLKKFLEKNYPDFSIRT